MRVGLFTDTYFPQVSGVATSIRTLKTELEKLGHTVFIFTTTDKDVNRYEDWQIIRIPSVPFFAFKDRRVAYRGFSKALAIAKQYQLDIIHTQTEFSLGLLGVWIGRELRIPVIHTYHTQYEDYVRYIARGMVIRPSMVKYIVRSYMNDLDGVICPSEIVYDLVLLEQVIDDLTWTDHSIQIIHITSHNVFDHTWANDHTSRNIADIVLILGMIGMNDWNPQLTSNPHSQKAQ